MTILGTIQHLVLPPYVISTIMTRKHTSISKTVPEIISYVLVSWGQVSFERKPLIFLHCLDLPPHLKQRVEVSSWCSELK